MPAKVIKNMQMGKRIIRKEQNIFPLYQTPRERGDAAFFSEEGGIVSCQRDGEGENGEGENGERRMMPGERPSSMIVSRSMSA